MKTYIGRKIIQAEPMSHNEFLESYGKDCSVDEDEPGYKVVYPDGYVRWSPADVFASEHREILPDELKLISEKK